jgi:hypothetical protein
MKKKKAEPMKIIDQINRDLEIIANGWATNNAHGWPITESGRLTLCSVRSLLFEEQIDITHPDCPQCLSQIADILQKYY